MRALTSHQCHPGSISGPGVIYGLSLLFGSRPCSEDFLPVLRFSSLHKNQHFQIHLESVDEKPLCGDATAKFQFIFIFYLFFFYFWERTCFSKPRGSSLVKTQHLTSFSFTIGQKVKTFIPVGQARVIHFRTEELQILLFYRYT